MLFNNGLPPSNRLNIDHLFRDIAIGRVPFRASDQGQNDQGSDVLANPEQCFRKIVTFRFLIIVENVRKDVVDGTGKHRRKIVNLRTHLAEREVIVRIAQTRPTPEGLAELFRDRWKKCFRVKIALGFSHNSVTHIQLAKHRENGR